MSLELVLKYLAFVSVWPLACGFVLLLNDDWRVGRLGRAGLLLWSLLVSLPLPHLILIGIHPLPFVTLLPLPLVMLPLWRCSGMRDARFLFLALSSTYLAFLLNALADKLGLALNLPALPFLMVLSACVAVLCARFYRPVFLDVCRCDRDIWWLLCPLPLLLFGVYICLLGSPNYSDSRELPLVIGLVAALLCLTMVLYAVLFHFFLRIRRLHEAHVGADALHAQCEALQQQLALQDATEEHLRILRHDLRHYLPLLEQLLYAGDVDGARALLHTMRALARPPAGEGDAGHG